MIAVTMAVFSVHATVWGVITVSLRQRVVPGPLLGRVNSGYFPFATGGAALGAVLSGVVADALGLAAPFWIAGGAMAVLTAVTWRRFSAHALASAGSA